MIKYTRPDWDSYFINIAIGVSSRATCLRRRYGAVIVKDNTIISTGYCGAPRGVQDCLSRGVCKRQELGIPSGERYELCVSVHAEANAIINGDPDRMKGAVIYVVGVTYEDGSTAEAKPCMMCRRMILNAQITRVVYQNKDGEIITVPSYLL